ncbi:MAG: nucleotidyl transferase AbiEii/AbiGii toxin family protein [Candidatus Thiodiazotropha sp. (ex Cardiolucina cf. quadrata)]|nr:nucleotidyl transferase AbiEii/AbiGii toxin family protein [Candidatus Thiodiazotropha sp. (ex Cardiolucina cf. quadrata)]
MTEITEGLATIGEEIQRTIPQVQIRSIGTDAPKLQIATPQARIKVEPSMISRGTLFPPVERDLCQAAQDEYELFVRVQRLTTGDLYRSKLCAALDRQHPRDLFDIKQLLDAREISDNIRQAFVVYLAGHRRPHGRAVIPEAGTHRTTLYSTLCGHDRSRNWTGRTRSHAGAIVCVGAHSTFRK